MQQLAPKIVSAAGHSDQNRCVTRIFPLFVAMVLLLGSTGQLFAAEQKSVTPTRPAMPVETMEVKISVAEQKIEAVGSLQSNESVILMPEIAGRLAKINFIEGESVQKGKLLIQLDDAVRKAKLDQAHANLALHESDYLRAEALLKDRAISEQERDTAYARWILDKASVDLAKAEWRKTRIYAPFSGTLGLRMISPGSYVDPGDAIVNLEDTRTLKVEFSIPEKYSGSIATGQIFALQTTAIAGREFSGEIYVIDPMIDVASRSLKLRGRLDNSEGLLWPGQFVKLQLTISTRENALFVPEQAVILQPSSNLVYRVVDAKAEMVSVQLGQRTKGWVEIVSGLSVGDVVVTGGHQKIGPGSPVQSIPADPALFEKL